jgi:hypothetical protein
MVYAYANRAADNFVETVEEWPSVSSFQAALTSGQLTATCPRFFFRSEGKESKDKLPDFVTLPSVRPRALVPCETVRIDNRCGGDLGIVQDVKDVRFFPIVLLALAGCDMAPVTIPGTKPDAGLTTCPECDVNAWCAQDSAAVICTCRDGWAGDGHLCVDADECALGTAPCDGQHGLCANTEGGYACACVSGWSLGSDGATCRDGFVAVQLSSDYDRTCALKLDGTIPDLLT